MNANTMLRAKVKRLLAGNLDLNDLTQLVFNLRHRSFGNDIIREIGDFIAHRDDRDKGLVTNYARNFFIYMAFGLLSKLGEKRLDPPYPPGFPEGLLAHLDILNDDEIFSGTGFRRKPARAHLKSFLNRLRPRKDSRLDVVRAATADEDRVLQFLASYIVFRPLFDEEQLFAAFVEVLKKNNLIEPDEVVSCSKLREPLALLAIELMHRCIIRTKGVITNLVAGTSEGKICVWATSCVPGVGQSIGGVFEVFPTKLRAADWCVEELANHNGVWQSPIELRSDGLLHPV